MDDDDDDGNGKSKPQYIRVHASFLPKVAGTSDDDDEDDEGSSRFRDFDADGVSSILTVLCDGDDHATVADNIGITAIIDGGYGNDKLKGGGGDDILSAGTGKDTIEGGRGADILIGALGCERLVGNKGDDILVGDRTVYDSDQGENKPLDVDGLLAILAEWSSGKSHDERKGNISADNLLPDRLNNGYFLRLGETIWDDGARDMLTGSSGKDWFIFSDKDKATDLGDEGCDDSDEDG